VNATDFRIDEPRPLSSSEDAPVVQTIHARRDAALRLAEKIRQWAYATPPGGWIEMNIVGHRLLSPALESLVVRGKGD
jgi:hypothetical protein